MALYTIIVFVALGLLGALIAYLGDVIGARLGKRRSTIFGLRPRQSARLVAAIIGGLLPLLGLGVATVGSRYARVAVFELQSLLDQRQQLQARVESLQGDVERFEMRVETAEARAEDAEETAAVLSDIRREQQERIEGLQSREDELQTRASGLRERVETLTARRDRLEGDLSEAQADLAQSRERLSEAEENLDTASDVLEQMQREVEQRQRRVEMISLQYDNVQDELARANRRLEPAQRELIATHEELTSLQDEVQELEMRLQQAVSHQELVAQRPDVLFEPWDELLRVVQRSDMSQTLVEADLIEWLHVASAVAERKGVPEGPNGRAVVLMAPTPRRIPPGEATERQIISHVAGELRAGGADEWVVMVLVYRRHFRGDRNQVAVAFRAVANELEFRAGEVLDEFVLSASIDELTAIETLWHRITDDDSPVRARAIAQGMLPRMNTNSYGAIELSSIYNAAKQIRAGSGRMLVQLKVASDTYTRGPLALEIEVGPAGGPS